MSVRSTLTSAARMARMSLSRATIREVDDKHLMQEVKQADVFHSETPSNFERWQMVGLTSVPLKQTEQKQNQAPKPSAEAASEEGDFNHDQPQGPAAEALMLYLNGSRSHPVALVDDRRVRPYGMKPGSSSTYASDGSEQMTYYNSAGAYLVSLDGPTVDNKEKKTRFASLRHVTKKMQTHKIEKGKETDDYKHEGESVNTEVRCTAGRIEFRAGDTVVGYYDKAADTWFLKGKIVEMQAETVTSTVTDVFEIVGKTSLGIDSKGENAPRVVTEAGVAKQTHAKTG